MQSIHALPEAREDTQYKKRPSSLVMPARHIPNADQNTAQPLISNLIRILATRAEAGTALVGGEQHSTKTSATAASSMSATTNQQCGQQSQRRAIQRSTPHTRPTRERKISEESKIVWTANRGTIAASECTTDADEDRHLPSHRDRQCQQRLWLPTPWRLFKCDEIRTARIVAH